MQTIQLELADILIGRSLVEPPNAFSGDGISRAQAEENDSN